MIKDKPARFKLQHRYIRFNVLLEIVSALFFLTVIGWAALDTWKGALRNGQMIAILQLAAILLQTVILAALTSLRIQKVSVTPDLLYEFTIPEPEYAPPPETMAGEDPLPFERLSMENLAFHFPGRRPLLKDVSLELKKGEIITLSGESGQGKSTLLLILQKFYPYKGGSVWVNDQEMQTISAAAWQKTIGLVPQDITVFGGTLLANICLDAATDNIDKVRKFCRHYGFDRYFENLPQSYNTLLGEGGVTLSGGQKQLLALARCLYAEPQLILLDEPTAAMDSVTERFVINTLQKVRQQAGLLVISHKCSFSEIADRTYLLDKGATCQIPRPAFLSMA